ncbi:MAG TPA: histidine phosphatase family protein [Acidisoma sp.]|jgi:alpha-ribazole phosphatase|nr:histidine phosphatase family protein [Acidisoma sp.]
MRYALVRHPAVTGGDGRCYGRLDLPLAAPEADIPPLIAALAPLWGAVIHTSPLSRCRVVADALGAAWDRAAIVDGRLLEMDFGGWEGVPWDDIPRAALDRWAADLPGFAPPGGESGADLIARVSAIWAETAAAGGAHVIITHGGPLKVLTALAAGQPIDLGAPALSFGAMICGGSREAA